MNIGIIGTGTIGRFHAEAIRAMHGGTLHSVFNHRPESALRLAAEFGVTAHSDLATFLADPDLQAVTSATPSGAHLEPTLAALAAGKHVFCEKPLEVTTARIDEVMAAAAALAIALVPPSATGTPPARARNHEGFQGRANVTGASL